MVIETEVFPFLEWLPWAALYWLIVVGSLAAAFLLFGYLVTAVQRGPWSAVKRTGRLLAGGSVDLLCMSPRRTWALAWLAVRESIRRWGVVVEFAVFVQVILLAGWYLDPTNPNPARLYLSFLLTTTSYLVLGLALFLSAFSLPVDIASRTLHTVVTKPVRTSEIVLGRILGFTLIGTALLIPIAGLSYGFVLGGLAHTHTLDPETLVLAASADAKRPETKTGRTSEVYGHTHQVYVSGNQGRVEPARGHWHKLTVEGSGDKTSYRIGLHEGMLTARVPIYGKLRFRDREGIDTTKGVNVGDEWTYRSYIQGGSPAAAIWTFQNIDPKSFPKGLPLEMVIGVFRTYKGDIEKGVLGSISVRNPRTGLTVEVEIFESEEFTANKLFIPRTIRKFSNAQVIPRKIRTKEGVKSIPARDQLDPGLAAKKEFDVFKDLVADGRVEIWLKCLEPAQYIGAAQPDLYLRATDASFELNFIKGYFGIWLQMVLVIGFGVMFSTYLSGPVAMIATLGALVGGFFSEFMTKLARGEVEGGGPIEALIRLVQQQNVVTEMNPGVGTYAAQMADGVAQYGLRVMSAILPAFGQFNYADYVAEGFDISWNLILVRSVTALAFLIPVFVAGYFFLKTREVAR